MQLQRHLLNPARNLVKQRVSKLTIGGNAIATAARNLVKQRVSKPQKTMKQ
jgi:hypothetical protein